MTTMVMTPVGMAVSRRFTGYDGWIDPGGRQLCAVCAWLYQHKPLRTEAHIITRRPKTMAVAPPQLLRKVLSRKVDTNTAVVIPLVPGRKHILSHARWGQVAVDDTTITWWSEDPVRLGALSRLRAVGFSESALMHEAPAFAVLRTLPQARWRAVFDDWTLLAPWRAADLWMRVGMKASRR
ncbi:MAG: hypothetical protein ACJA07_001528 [Rhodococcus sp. (in: high G+C Gram-positive bacteria)]|jgi:hypothetical protein